jgi:hypothetical protein
MLVLGCGVIWNVPACASEPFMTCAQFLSLCLNNWNSIVVSRGTDVLYKHRKMRIEATGGRSVLRLCKLGGEYRQPGTAGGVRRNGWGIVSFSRS